jgi:hypothetical protein
MPRAEIAATHAAPMPDPPPVITATDTRRH